MTLVKLEFEYEKYIENFEFELYILWLGFRINAIAKSTIDKRDKEIEDFNLDQPQSCEQLSAS